MKNDIHPLCYYTRGNGFPRETTEIQGLVAPRVHGLHSRVIDADKAIAVDLDEDVIDDC